ncbi:DUF1015 domain-containing protein [Verrucomicrobiota bacterium]
MRIKPFQPLHPVHSHAGSVASVPYDTVDRSEAAALASNNPLSFLHVSRAEIDLPDGTDPYDESVYQKALENFQVLQKKGILITEREPCLYLYRMTRGDHTQRGVVACCHVDDYRNDTIKKHEKTRKEKEMDRTRHMSKLSAHVGPVLLMHRDQPDIDRITRRIETEKPLYDITAPDDVSHTIWKIRNSRPFVTAFQEAPVCYIADGHHRAASAVRVALERQRANPSHRGDEEYNWFLGILFPASQLHILPYNRSVRDLNGKTAGEFLEAVQSQFTVKSNANPRPDAAGNACMYVDGRWYDLSWKATCSPTDPVDSLDVSVLQSRLLGPILGIRDPRTDERIKYIGGVRDTDELERLVDSGQAAVAFSMFPTSVNQLMAIADTGQSMPPKSTWFEPKPMSGLLIHPF